MTIAIVGNGNAPDTLLNDIKKADVIIGVDRASYWLITHGIVPHIAVGDFDSINKDEFKIVSEQISDVRQYSPKKDATDLELAIDAALVLRPKEVVVYGSSGTRFDHTTIAVNLLEKFLKKDIPVVIRDKTNEIGLLSSRRTINKSSRYKYLSVIPYFNKATITLRGVLYPVSKKVFHKNSSLGISNEIVASRAEIEVHTGTVIIIRSTD